MKIKYLLLIAVTALAISCSNDNEDDGLELINEVAQLKKVQDFTTENHTIEIYTQSGEFSTGYNEVFIRIKDNTTNTFIEDASLSWMPIMQMPSMEHSCPKSAISKVINTNTLFKGFVIFQMTGQDRTGWRIKFTYTFNGITFETEKEILVTQSKRQRVTSIMGSDENRYVLALIEPQNPKVAINKIKVGLYKMENMMSFPVVENYTIGLDPRMPGMGNHSSPNNKDLTYNVAEQLYEGDLSLTMTGYWVLNLKLFNSENTLLKGEDVTESNPQSSLYLEVEF